MNNRVLYLRPVGPGQERSLRRPVRGQGQPLAMPVNGPDQPVRLASTRGASGQATPATSSGADDYETMFVSNLRTIERAIRHVCQRQGLAGFAAEEFDSEVKLRLIEHNYEVFRKFQQRSSLRTYLTVVIQHLYLDYRNHLWGKWRPSAEARRLGPVAIRLETLVARDGFTFAEACEHLRTNEDVVATDADLDALLVRLPNRTRRKMVSEDGLEEVADSTTRVDERMLSGEGRVAARRVLDALTPVTRSLADQDRLILRLRFQDGLGVADIARALHLDQKRLYRQFDALLQRLRTALEAAGISHLEACELLNRNDVDITLALLGETPETDPVDV